MARRAQSDSRGETAGFPWKRRVLGIALLPLAFLAQYLASGHPEWIEENYSRGVYPYISAGLGLLFGWLPVSAAELGIGFLGLWVFGKTFGGLTAILGGSLRVSDALIGALTWMLASAGYVAALFLLLWGLNYSRLSFAGQARWEIGDVPAAELLELGRELAGEVSRLRPDLPEDDAGVLRLDADRRTVMARTRSGFLSARAEQPLLSGPVRNPKPAWLSPVLSRLGISGIYMPLTGEPHINAELTPSELPVTTAHEVAHGLGYAREDEANFVAALVCRAHEDPLFRYSGALESLVHVFNALSRAGDGQVEAELRAGLHAGVKRDIAAWVERYAKHQGELTEIASRVNDRYLKSQGQSAGLASYGLVVELLIAERRARRAAGRLPETSEGGLAEQAAESASATPDAEAPEGEVPEDPNAGDGDDS